MFNFLILINVAYMLKQIWRHNLLLGSNLRNKKIGAIWLLLSKHS